MKHLLPVSLQQFAKPLVLILPLLFASCGDDAYFDEQNKNVFNNDGQPGGQRRPQFGYQGGTTQTQDGANNAQPGQAPAATDPAVTPGAPTTDPLPAGTPPPSGVPGSDPLPQPTVNPQPPTAGGTPPAVKTPKGATLPFGVPVAGKKGFVYSPFAPEKGMVDVTGLDSGTKVECPYTFKHFRVP